MRRSSTFSVVGFVDRERGDKTRFPCPDFPTDAGPQFRLGTAPTGGSRCEFGIVTKPVGIQFLLSPCLRGETSCKAKVDKSPPLASA